MLDQATVIGSHQHFPLVWEYGSRDQCREENYWQHNGHLSQEAIIAVMGASSVGKSSFIRLVTSDNLIRVGETLHSGT